MNVCRLLPWRRRAARAERLLHEAREALHEVREDWPLLTNSLHRINREIELNDWTRTAHRIFAGGKR